MRIILFIGLLFSFLSVQAQMVKKEIRRGNKQYEEKKYSEAEIHYRKALEKDPKQLIANYNLGNALYKENQYAPSITKYQDVIGSAKDSSDLSGFYYNLGNAYFKSHNLDKSIEAYKQSLRINPEDQDAKHNLFLAETMKKKQQNQQNKNQKNKNNKDKNKNNKQNQDQNKDQKQKQDKNKQNQNKQEDQEKNNDKDKNKAQQEQISKADADRLLEALGQDEKNTLKKVQEEKARVRKVPVDKDW